MQEYGTIEAAFMLARTNDMGITDTLQAGQEIETPEKVYKYEAADLLYHLLVLLKQRELRPSAIFEELKSRR